MYHGLFFAWNNWTWVAENSWEGIWKLGPLRRLPAKLRLFLWGMRLAPRSGRGWTPDSLGIRLCIYSRTPVSLINFDICIKLLFWTSIAKQLLPCTVASYQWSPLDYRPEHGMPTSMMRWIQQSVNGSADPGDVGEGHDSPLSWRGKRHKQTNLHLFVFLVLFPI
jgi:hypothetical protein